MENKSATERLDKLFAKRNSIKPGLDRVRRAWDCLRLSPPPCVIIGGTNGKGSTSGMLWHMLAALDMPVGLFTSPHVVHFHERIQCSHQPITSEKLIEELDELEALLPYELYQAMSFFEVTTILALRLFSKVGCRLVVLEVGMGGRWDATNIVEPIASAVISIDFDHQNYLGDTLAKIAREKLGIARQGKPLFWGERRASQKPGLSEALASAQAELGFQLFEVGQHFAYLPDTQTVTMRLPGFAPSEIVLPSWVKRAPTVYQHNFAISVALFHYLVNTLGENTSVALAKALQRFGDGQVPWPPSLMGRFQKLSVTVPWGQQDFILDVAHNVAATEEFIDSLRDSGILKTNKNDIPGLISILSDKDINGMLDRLRDVIRPLVLFEVPSERSLRPSDLAERHAQIPVMKNFAQAYQYAMGHWSDLKKPWVVCGSFLAVGEVLQYFAAYPKVLCESLPRGFDPSLEPTDEGPDKPQS